MTRRFLGLAFTVVSLFVIFSGCDSAAEPSDTTTAQEVSVSSEAPEVSETSVETSTVAFQGISLDIPNTWEYDISGESNSQLTAYPDPEQLAMITLMTQTTEKELNPGNPDDLQMLAELFFSTDELVNPIEIGEDIVSIDGIDSLRKEYTAQVSEQNVRGVTYFYIADEGAAIYVCWLGADLDSNFIDATIAEFDESAQSMDFSNFVAEGSSPVSEEAVDLSSSAVESSEDSTVVSASGNQTEALETALNYLSFMAFSREGLIGQLEYEGYTTEDATWAVDNCGADWNEQAIRKAENYVDTMAFSYSGLIDQLEYEGFTTEQATYGVDNITVDWNEQAAKKAQSYLDFTDFSRQELVDQLLYEGFTQEQAQYGVTQVGM